MINEIITLFRREVPGIYISDETISDILSDKTNHFIYRKDKDKLIGVSVINENTIYLLLVDNLCQKQGIGLSLLEESEDYIKSKGFDKIKLGVGKDYIVPGAPMINDAYKFFIKHGYHHSWGEQECVDMSISLCDFIFTGYKIGDTIDGNLYRFANPGDMKGIVDCCREDASSFIEHYMNEKLYEPDSSDPVIVAEKDGEILGALMIGTESGDNKTGYLGCIITAPRHRNKGIATNIMKVGTSYLKSMGSETIWLSYTYTEIVNKYSKLGYKICMKYFMGEKKLHIPRLLYIQSKFFILGADVLNEPSD